MEWNGMASSKNSMRNIENESESEQKIWNKINGSKRKVKWNNEIKIRNENKRKVKNKNYVTDKHSIWSYALRRIFPAVCVSVWVCANAFLCLFHLLFDDLSISSKGREPYFMIIFMKEFYCIQRDLRLNQCAFAIQQEQLLIIIYVYTAHKKTEEL